MLTTCTRSIGLVLVFGLLAGSMRAEETSVEPPESVGEDLTPSVGDVIKGSALLGISVHDSDGAVVGKGARPFR